MALMRGGSNSPLDPFLGSSIFDPFEGFPLFGHRHFTGFGGFPQEISSVANTRVDWVETPEAHIFKADLPGLKKEEVKIQVTEDKLLSVSGERNKEQVDEKDSYRRMERSYGKFHRQFRLPKNTKVEEISAKMENGVLTITVPKAAVEKKPEVRNVDITS
ncbi:hypothetical protein R1sor_011134 [Riccia sorocarpa]|uniref:SHSP domain-containing protein n=1 Tax=Riccia sorocarpa TaxID=122646 RepID=A0ABD3I0C9_9MARC